MNNKYNDSRIYKIVDIRDNNTVYIGSTTTSIKVRFNKHKSDSKKPKCPIHEYMNKEGANNFKAVIIETVNCRNKDELTRIEDEYISEARNNGVEILNRFHATLNIEKDKLRRKNYFAQTWYPRNKDLVRENNAFYRNHNKERISARRKEKIHCDICDCHISRDGFHRHVKSKKHLLNLDRHTI